MMSRFRPYFRRLLQSKVQYRPFFPTKFCIRINPRTILPCTVSFSILTLIGLEKELNAEDELILMIKHSLLFMQRNEYAKAEQLLHVALRQAQQMQHENGITYIYDLLANLALQRERLDQAKKLFVSVAQRLISSGVKEDDLRIVQVSVKLARVSHLQKEYETAQLGFDWCLKRINNEYQKNPTEELKKLLAMTEDWYGRLFVECNKYDNGFSYMLSAYNKMKELKDIDPEHVVVQLNDIGTVCDQMDHVDDCIHYVSKALDLGKTLPEMEDLGAINVNLGRAYIKKNMIESARQHCGYGLKLAILNKNNDIKKEADACIAEIKNMNL